MKERGASFLEYIIILAAFVLACSPGVTKLSHLVACRLMTAGSAFELTGRTECRVVERAGSSAIMMSRTAGQTSRRPAPETARAP